MASQHSPWWPQRGASKKTRDLERVCCEPSAGNLCGASRLGVNRADRTMNLNLERNTPVIGATLKLDLAEALRAGGAQKQAAIEHVYEALIAHLVIFIEDQHLTPAEQVDFALQFGGLDVPHPVYQTLKGCPEIVELENDGDRPPDTNDWHTDLTFRPNPPFMSILYAKQVPQTGGDTLWSNLYAVFDALPDDLKALLRGQSAIHDIGTFRNDFLTDTMDVKAVNQGLFDTGSAVHRIVQTHPVTHREFLYVNPSFTQHIVGFKKSESDRLLRYLYDHANQPEFQVRYRWRPNSLALWDNRVTQHYAIADYLPEYRKMHRVTVINDLRSP